MLNGHIPNHELKPEDLPAPYAPWSQIRDFAFSYHAYEHRGGQGPCAQIANSAIKNFRDTGQIPATMTDLRTCLFFEQRRKVHQASDFDEEMMRYIHALVEGIRILLLSKKTE